MCHTQELYLSRNKIGDAGLTALAKAVESGALASLETLSLNNNGIGDEGMSALAKAITPDKDGKGALAQLTRLDLAGNGIGDAGLTALAEAIKPTADNASGALDHLTVCWRPTALFPCLETWLAHFLDPEVLFDVP